jgi:hypothetical protein
MPQASQQTQTPAETKAPPVPLPPEHRSETGAVADHGGVYSRFREILATAGGQQPPPEQLASMFRSPEYSHPVNDTQKARVLSSLQPQFGSRYLRSLAAPPETAEAEPVLRAAETDPQSADVAEARKAMEQSPGKPLDTTAQRAMGSRFGHDFSGVSVHDDPAAHRAASDLNAAAFSTGRDIYFSRGAYNPASSQGQSLLSHELAHVVQHDVGATRSQKGVSQPGDVLERDAESMGNAAMRGESPPHPKASAAPAIQRQASPAREPDPARATPGTAELGLSLAGLVLPLPLKDFIDKAKAGQVTVPNQILRRLPDKPLKITEITLNLDDDKKPAGGKLAANVNIPLLDGNGQLDIDKTGNVSGSVSVTFHANKFPVLKETTVNVMAAKDDLVIAVDVPFAISKVNGALHYKYNNGKHSGKAEGKYEGAKFSGEVEGALSEDGKFSGSAKLKAELFKNLNAEADASINEKGDVKIAGKITLASQIELFPEKKFEKSFFNFERKFPLWGFTIPVIDVNVGLFAEIHASAGFRAKFGPGVLRDVQLTGEFGTDPEAVTEIGLSGEFFVPAGAEIVVTLGGGIGLGLAVADITGGIDAVGVAGIYAALSVRPQLKYSGGKYTISGTAELGGVAQLKLGINAFAKVDVGVWLFKGTVWRKDWTLAEWVWNTGLNVALRANISYTLGEDFAPDFSFETGQVDPEKMVRDVMPESGSPVSAPPKPATPDKSSFNAEGAAGGAKGGEAPAAAPPPTPGTPPAATQKGTPPAAGGPGGAPAGGAPGAAGAAPGAQPKGPESKEEAWKLGVQGVIGEVNALENQEIDTDTIKAALPQWRTKYGFKELTLQTTKEEWLIEGSMSPAAPVDKVKRKTIKPKGDGKDMQRILKGQLLDLTDFINPPGARLTLDPNYVSPRDPKQRSNRDRAQRGLTAFLRNDDRVELHHVDQDFFSALDEHSAAFHQSVVDDPDFHPFANDPGYLSWRGEVGWYSGQLKTLGAIYNSIRRKYWMARF